MDITRTSHGTSFVRHPGSATTTRVPRPPSFAGRARRICRQPKSTQRILEFPALPRRFCPFMLTLSGISKAYGGQVLFAEAALQVNRQDRIGLVGPNGAGKTTLFSIILGTESPDDGKMSRERGVTLGYLPQETAVAGDETVIELATSIAPDFVKLRRIIKAWEADHPVEALHAEEIHDNVHDRFNQLGGYRLEAKAKQILAGLSFRESDFERPAREMSGGWGNGPLSALMYGAPPSWEHGKILTKSTPAFHAIITRSEERRVGKECRCGWS